MAQWQTLLGQITLEITCADSVTLLNALSENKIRLKDVTYCGDLTMHVTIAKSDYKDLLEIAKKQGASVKIVRLVGAFWIGRSVVKRPVLLAVFVAMLLLTLYLPSRILFISVEGNTTIPTNLILEAANDCGIRFGVSRRQIRSEVMKNALLQKIPQLQWAGVNTSGCTAVISVREKTAQEVPADTNNQVCSIVAARDGVIQDCTVYEGNPLCVVGQAVKAGQTLVSGYLDCGIVIKATRASAEIKALTFRELEVVTPAATATRGELCTKKVSYSLRFGKKLIKLSKDSGNSDATCAKIYSEEYVCLPGGFYLPISVIKETQLFYENSEQMPAASDSEEWLADLAQSHLESSMIVGEVISAQTEVCADDDVCYLYGKYACIEMIGQVKYEQTMLKDGEND